MVFKWKVLFKMLKWSKQVWSFFFIGNSKLWIFKYSNKKGDAHNDYVPQVEQGNQIRDKPHLDPDSGEESWCNAKANKMFDWTKLTDVT